MLQRLGRTDEMVAQYDGRIRAAAENPTLRLTLLRRKATALIDQPDVDRTIAAMRDYQAAAEPKSEKWLDATGFLAFVLERAKRYAEAIEVRKQIIEHSDGPGARLALARDQQALGLLDEARDSIDQAEIKAQAVFAKNTERQNEVQKPRFKEAVAKLRQLVGPGK